MSGPAVWHGLNQAELDVQYNSRGTVEDVSVYLNQYSDRTQQAKSSQPCVADLAYGPHADDRLDIYLPRHTRAPVLVFLHGGDWQMLSKDDGGFAAPAFVDAGALFVALDFSRVPSVTVPEMGAQVKRALMWLFSNLATYGGDPRRIHIAGHSSGANLVGQLLMVDWSLEDGMPGDLIKSAVFISGLGDLEPVRLSFRNEKLALTPEDVTRVSLLRRGALAHCPMVVAVGANETGDYLRQSRDVATWWKSRGAPCQLFELEGRHHFDTVLHWAEQSSDLFKAQYELMDLGRVDP